MTAYRVPLREIGFVLEHIAPLSELSPAFADIRPDDVMGLLEEAARFAEDVVAPTNHEGDQQGARLVGGRVITPEPFPSMYRKLVAAGWGTLPHPPEYGGGGLPMTASNAVREMLASANLAFSMSPLLTGGAACLLARHASTDQMRRYLPSMVAGEWTASMDITEPQAGSDLGATATRAVPQADGSYRIFGQKIFISYGDHDLSEQIVHLVLARIPGAPAGSKGLSLFLVPKYLVTADGSLGGRNDVNVVGLEHKLGIRASPTCVISYGDGGSGASGELVGAANNGMRLMFTMMNDARLGVGLQGLGVGERAYQQAVAFAAQRRQGRAHGAAPGVQSPIIEHPDIRRMLLTMKAYLAAMRCLLYANGHAIDLAEHHPDAQMRAEQQELADVLTPVAKAWCTDLGVEIASLAVQVAGGMGFIEEVGLAQYYRDVRITPIYEGTNGIQALDLVERKLVGDSGGAIRRLLGRVGHDARALPASLPYVRTALIDAVGAAGEATDWMVGLPRTSADRAAGASAYLRLLATVLGGWHLARGAAVAVRLGQREPTDPFLATKVLTAGFYATHLLPEVCSLLPRVTAGAASVLSLAPEQFIEARLGRHG